MLAVGLVAGLIISAPARAIEEEPWGFSKPCPDVLVIGYRGSGQPLTQEKGLGTQVSAYYQEIANQVRASGHTVAFHASPYPAVPVEKGLGEILSSVNEGLTDSIGLSSVVDGLCDNKTKIVLIGYSQGAMVVHDSLQWFKDRLLGAVFLGDPYFNPKEGGTKFGGYYINRTGILGSADEDEQYHSSLYSVCLRYDIVCQGNQLDGQAIIDAWASAPDVHTNGYQSKTGLLLARAIGIDISDRLNGPESGLGAAGVAIMADSSGSMLSNDPKYLRRSAGLAFVSASTRSDRVGVVDFDSNAVVLSEAVNPVDERDALEAALNQIDADGGTNIGAALDAGCGVLGRSGTQESKAGILLTDGDGDYSNEASCFAHEKWPVYTFGLGESTNDALLNQIAKQTGGEFVKLDDTSDMVCQFQRVRALIGGTGGGTCNPVGTIHQGEVTARILTVKNGLKQTTFMITWPGSDVSLTAISPSGRRVDRGTVADDIRRETGSTFDSLTIDNPEPGDWVIEVEGLVVADTGEPYTLQQTAVPLGNQPPAIKTSVVKRGLSVQVSAAGTKDPDGNEVEGYLWSFSDGAIASGPDVSHRFAAPGTYEVTLVAVDGLGASSTTSFSVEVGGLSRWSGADRYEASAAISQASFEPGVATAYIASGLVFTDALSGSPVAGKTPGPVLLVKPDEIPGSIASELARLKPDRIVVLGGPNTIGADVETELVDLLP